MLLLIKDKFDRLMKMASECGGIEKMESDFQRFGQMKSRYGGFEEIDSKLNKLEQIEAESAVFEKLKTMFGGIHNIVPGLDRLKKTEFQHMVFKPNQTERPFITFLPASPDFLQAFSLALLSFLSFLRLVFMEKHPLSLYQILMVGRY